MASQYWAQFLKNLIEKILSLQKTWFTDFFFFFFLHIPCKPSKMQFLPYFCSIAFSYKVLTLLNFTQWGMCFEFLEYFDN